jgi:peroxiredoxin
VSSKDQSSRLGRLVAVAFGLSLVIVAFLLRRVESQTALIRELEREIHVLQPGAFVPTFHTTTIAGDTITIGGRADTAARQVLFVLTTTCPYCRATQPVWMAMADSLRRVAPSVQVLGVTLDSVNATLAYADSLQLSYPIARFPQIKLLAMYRAGLVPQTIVLNAEGRVLHSRTGVLEPGPGLDSIYGAALGRP